MKPIKFRGKTKEGKWVYGYYVYCRYSAYILPIHNLEDPDPCFDERWIQEGADDDGWIEVIPETVGQFVCADKNKKDVFAGDKAYGSVWLEDLPIHRIVGEVIYYNCGYCIQTPTTYYHLSDLKDIELIEEKE